MFRRDKQTFVTTKDVFCCDKLTFAATKLQTVCPDKHTFVEKKDVFVATKMILVAAPANDTQHLRQLRPAVSSQQSAVSSQQLQTCF